MKNIFIYLIFCSFVSAENFPIFRFDLDKVYNEFKSVSVYKKESDLISEKWETKSYYKKVLNDKGLRGFFIGIQYWYGTQTSSFSGDAMYKNNWLVNDQKNISQSEQALSFKLGYIFGTGYFINPEPETKMVNWGLYISPSLSLGYGFDKTAVFSLGGDIGISTYGIFVFVGAYYIYQKNHTSLSADFKAFPAVFKPEYQSLKLDDSMFSNNSFAYDIGIGYQVFRHIYVDIRYRYQLNFINKDYVRSKEITLGNLSSSSSNFILGLNYNF